MHCLPRSILAELPERGIQERWFSPNPRVPGFPGRLGECTVTEVPCRDSDQVGRYCDRLVVFIRHRIHTYDFPVVRRAIGRWTDADRGQQHRQDGRNLCAIGLSGCQPGKSGGNCKYLTILTDGLSGIDQYSTLALESQIRWHAYLAQGVSFGRRSVGIG